VTQGLGAGAEASHFGRLLPLEAWARYMIVVVTVVTC
jgi:hypothetical protein